MKKFLHFEFETKNTLLSPEIIARFTKYFQDKLGDEWIVVASPMKPTISEDLEHFYNFELKQFTKEELLKLLDEK